jgi:hypothetical protein
MQMNKSTPINQLPTNSNSNQGNFVNDQQRQMITQAQAAIQTSVLPQNTQISNDIINNEDDPTIEEVLNHFNTQQPQQQHPSPNQNNDINLLHQMQMQMQQQQQQPSLMQMQSQPSYYNPQMQMLMDDTASLHNMETQQNQQSSSSTFNVYLGHFTTDIKLVFLVFVLYIVVSFIPINRIIPAFVATYINIEKLPHHEVLIKALMIASAFMLLKKYCMD